MNHYLTLRLGPVDIHVYLVPDLDHAGEWDPEKDVILIRAGMTQLHTNLAILHELIHATSDFYELDLSEKDVRVLEMSLGQLFIPPTQ